MPLSRGIFQTQELNPGLPHYRQIPYHLNHQGSPVWPHSPPISESSFWGPWTSLWGNGDLNFTWVAWLPLQQTIPTSRSSPPWGGSPERDTALPFTALGSGVLVCPHPSVWPPIRAESLMFLGCGSFPLFLVWIVQADVGDSNSLFLPGNVNAQKGRSPFFVME